MFLLLMSRLNLLLLFHAQTHTHIHIYYINKLYETLSGIFREKLLKTFIPEFLRAELM